MTSSLKQYHEVAIQLRYKGWQYADIGKKLREEFPNAMNKGSKIEFTTGTIRQWFKSGGLLDAEYNEFKDKENERMRRASFSEMAKLIGKLPKQWEQLLERDQPDKLMLKTLVEFGKQMGLNAETEEEKKAWDEYLEKMDRIYGTRPSQ